MDGCLRPWARCMLEPITTPAMHAEANSAMSSCPKAKPAFSLYGTRLAYAANNGTVRAPALDLDDLIDPARSWSTRLET